MRTILPRVVVTLDPPLHRWVVREASKQGIPVPMMVRELLRAFGLDRPARTPVELRWEKLARIGTAISSHLQRTGVTEKRVGSDFAVWRKDRRARRHRR